MPLFAIQKEKAEPVEQSAFQSEKELQRLIEKNLGSIFSARFVASEFSTGSVHSGRIDTLALSEDGNPMILEYKVKESSDLINQSLFYVSWIQDHHGDFEIAAQGALGASVQVDWSSVRVVCMAPNFRKYDIHAVQMMGANIELWTYRLFQNNVLYLEEVLRKTYTETDQKNPVMVEAGRKAAKTRSNSVYTLEQHFDGKPANIHDLFLQVQEFITGLDSAIEEVPRQLYIAYKISQNIACVETRRNKILIYLKLNPASLKELPSIARDVTNIGHYGSGDLEVTIKNQMDIESARPLIEMAYRHVGG